MSSATAPRLVGRYAIYDPIATGGMATVHLGRLVGPVGFARTVAVKRLHPQFARDPEFVTMFLDEARLAARIQHPNVVPTIDVIATDGELLLIMEYVRGEALSKLRTMLSKRGERIPPRIAVAVMVNALAGLHAAHEATDERGTILGIVHRDVSPQNILVGMDGVARVLDFGVAKAEDRVQVTREGQLKGKLLYMSPEQLEGGDVDRRTDIYAMGVVLFEILTGTRMFLGETQAAQLTKITRGHTRAPGDVVAELSGFDAVVKKATALDPKDRYGTAREMVRALESVIGPASPHDVGEWVDAVAGVTILERTRRIAEIESAGRLDRDDVRASLAHELARSSMPELGAETSGVSSKNLPPDSQASGSGALHASPAPVQSSSRGIVVVLALLLVAGISVSVFLAVRGRPPATASLPTVAPPPSAATSVAVAASHAEDPLVASSTPAGSAAPPVPTPTVVATGGAHARHPAPSASASVKKPDCEQPYVVDSAGHMHFRKECL